ncbi:MAG: transaldolase family protein [Gammaproteobacteria bacterium]
MEQHGRGLDETAFAQLTSRLRFLALEDLTQAADLFRPIHEATNRGARSQRLLWASTGTKDPTVSDVLYVVSLAAPHTVNTMPEKTLLALADHGEIAAMLPHDGGDAEEVLSGFRQAGIDLKLAATLQADGAGAFVKSWEDLLACIGEKSETLLRAG